MSSHKQSTEEMKENKVKLTRKERQELAKAKLEKKGLSATSNPMLDSESSKNKSGKSSISSIKNSTNKKEISSKSCTG